MKKLLLLLLILAFSGTVNAQVPEHLWAQSAGGGSSDYNKGCATDASGNTIVTGRFRGYSMTIGSTTLTNAASSSYDIYVVKYDPDGNVLWAKSAGGDEHDYATSCTTDPSGNIIVTGYFQSPSIVFGSTTLTSYDDNDRIFTVKYDPNGNVLWARQSVDVINHPVLGTYRSDGRSNSCSTDADGNIIIMGEFTGVLIKFGSEPLVYNTNSGYYDIFVLKYSPDGDVIWLKTEGASAHDYGRSCSTDPSGNIIITGEYVFPITIGSTTLPTIGAGNEVFVAKYDPDGNALWARSAGGNRDVTVSGSSTDDSGNVIITGGFRSDSIAFGPSTFYNAGDNTTWDAFVAKYDPAGNFLWARSAGGVDTDRSNDCTTDASGNIIITGYFNSPSITFGSTTLANPGLFIVKYLPDGTPLWAQSSSGGTGTGNSCSADPSENIIVAGEFSSPSITFGLDTLTNANSGGSSPDVFVTKIHELLAIAGTDVQTACDSYLWIDGNTYTESNSTATHTIQGVAALGWDSIISLDLTIFNSTTGVDLQSICDNSFTWIDGNTYSASNNTATFTLAGGAANGCDSVVTLDLTINESSTGIDMQSMCDDSLTWIDGNTYTESNTTAMHTIVGGAANGCDSIVTLDLTIYNSSTATDVQTACGSYDWIDGNTYTTSSSGAIHTIAGGAVNGCDSIVSLDLTILPLAAGTDVQTACVSYQWVDGNTYTSSNNSATYTYSGMAANGCDSVVTLNLTLTTVNTNISVIPPSLTAGASGAIYQWLDCDDNYAEIPGEDERSFTPTENGNYAFAITQNGCTDTSNCYTISGIGIEDHLLESTISVYPIPAANHLRIESDKYELLGIRLYDEVGRLVLSKNLNNKAIAEVIDVSGISKGVYLLTIETEVGNINRKVIIER